MKNEVIYRYDSSSDVLGIKVNRRFRYHQTVEIDDVTLLDFDVGDVPVSLEVIDASKRFNFPPKSMNDITSLSLDVCVDEKSIALKASVSVLVDGTQRTHKLESSTCNQYDISNGKTRFELA